MESTKLGQKLYPGIMLMGEARKGGKPSQCDICDHKHRALA